MSETLRRYLATGGLLALVFSLIWGLRRLLSLGGRPTQRGAQVTYRLRPMTRVLTFLMIAGGIFTCREAWRNPKHVDGSVTGLLLLVGSGFVVGGIMAHGVVVLDPTGIHYRSFMRRSISIHWRDLHHVETLYNARAMSTVYYIRASQDRTIQVADTAFDVMDLLRRIRIHHPLPLRPYTKRKWYGG